MKKISEQNNHHRCSVSGTVSGECKCECHDPGGLVIHFMECCHPCPLCGLNIAYPGSHMDECRGSEAVTRPIIRGERICGAVHGEDMGHDMPCCKECPSCGRFICSSEKQSDMKDKETEEHEEIEKYIAECDELALFMFINGLMGVLFQASADSMKPEFREKEIQKEIAETLKKSQEILILAAKATSRFEVVKPIEKKYSKVVGRTAKMPTTEYHLWFNWWKSYFDAITPEKWNELKDLIEKEGDISAFRPEGDWKQSDIVGAIPKSWLTEQTSFDEVDESNPSIPQKKWQAIKDYSREGDQVWRFKSPEAEGKKGFALVRDGNAIVEIDEE